MQSPQKLHVLGLLDMKSYFPGGGGGGVGMKGLL